MDTVESASGLDTNFAYELGENLYRHHAVEYSTAHRTAKAAAALLEPKLAASKRRAEVAEYQLRGCAIHMSEKADALAAANARIAELEATNAALRRVIDNTRA